MLIEKSQKPLARAGEITISIWNLPSKLLTSMHIFFWFVLVWLVDHGHVICHFVKLMFSTYSFYHIQSVLCFFLIPFSYFVQNWYKLLKYCHCDHKGKIIMVSILGAILLGP